MATWKDMAYGLSRGAWGGIGAGAGLAKGLWDKTLGDDSGASLSDYVRTGWNVGKENAGLMATSMIEGAADAVPFVEFETPKAVAAQAQRDAMARGLDSDAAAAMRVGAANAGNVAANAATMRGLSWLTRTRSMLGTTGKTAKLLRGAVIASPTVDQTVGAYRSASAEEDKIVKSEYARFLKAMEEMDPSSPEYHELYDVMASKRHLNPSAFAGLRKPDYANGQFHGQRQEPAEVRESGQAKRFSMSPSVQDALGYGLGGALLGGLFGGKGGWWKMALLGLLLGSLKNGLGGFGNVWNDVRGARKGVK